ncbi:hypothetical protein ABIF24_005595 [Bradyrhizobium elkanii]|uniref:hypothetical protein n=1 Tax=Bradyrhizobium elkanii TaxID=29448 RepID=UPI0035171459
MADLAGDMRKYHRPSSPAKQPHQFGNLRYGLPTSLTAAGWILLDRFADRHPAVTDRAVLHVNHQECGPLAESSRATQPCDGIGLALFERYYVVPRLLFADHPCAPVLVVERCQ